MTTVITVDGGLAEGCSGQPLDVGFGGGSVPAQKHIIAPSAGLGSAVEGSAVPFPQVVISAMAPVTDAAPSVRIRLTEREVMRGRERPWAVLIDRPRHALRRTTTLP